MKYVLLITAVGLTIWVIRQIIGLWGDKQKKDRYETYKAETDREEQEQDEHQKDIFEALTDTDVEPDTDSVTDTDSVYKQVYGAVLSAQEIANEREAAKYLRDLQFYVRNLRAGQRAETIKVDYSDEDTVAAYMLTYYPFNVLPAEDFLRTMRPELKQRVMCESETLKVALLGAGPCPEILPLVRTVATDCENLQHLEVSSYDNQANKWSFGRRITDVLVRKYLEQAPNGFRYDHKPYKLDLSSSQALHHIHHQLRETKLLIIQNLLSGIAPMDAEAVVENITSALNIMPANGMLVLINETNHIQARDLMDTIETKIVEHKVAEIYKSVRNPKRLDVMVREGDMPEELTTYLFNGQAGLTAHNIMNFYYGAYLKSGN